MAHHNMATEVVVVHNTHALIAMRDGTAIICLGITSIRASKIRYTYFSRFNSKILTQRSSWNRIDCNDDNDAEDCLKIG
jgi:S-adenosylmethionine:tRNA-ribosyltransferase-isomerase (queuine synthetase)